MRSKRERSKLNLAVGVALVCALGMSSVGVASAGTQQVVSAGCSDAAKASVLATIGSQNKSLGRRDFKSAFAYASVNFRASTSLTGFTQIISRNYPFLASAWDLKIVDCAPMGKFLHVQVEFMDNTNNLYSMVYVLAPQSKKEMVAPNKTGYGISAAEVSQAPMVPGDTTSAV